MLNEGILISWLPIELGSSYFIYRTTNQYSSEYLDMYLSADRLGHTCLMMEEEIAALDDEVVAAYGSSCGDLNQNDARSRKQAGFAIIESYEEMLKSKGCLPEDL